MVSQQFIDECKNGAYKNRIGSLIVGSFLATNADYLSQMVFKDSCYSDGNIVGSVYTKSLNADLVHVPLGTQLINNNAIPNVGITYDTSEEQLDFDTYIVSEVKDGQTSGQTSLVAYDYLSKFDKVYECKIETFPCTIKEFLVDICEQEEITLLTTTFDNDSIPVIANPFTNNETEKQVLQEICRASCNFARYNVEQNGLELAWLDDEVSYTFETSDYTTLEGGSIVYGPVNSVMVGNSQVDGENVTLEDEESINLNGETQVFIDAPYFLYTQELREQAIQTIYNKLKGLKYTQFKLTTLYGKPFLKCGNKVAINTNEGQHFESYVLTHEFTYNGAFSSVIEAPMLTKEQRQYKNTTNSISVFKNVQNIVDKQEGQIIDIIEQQTETQNALNETIRDLNAIRNIFQLTGGTNLIKNSQFLFVDETWTFESQDGDPLAYHTPLGQGYNAALIGQTTSIANIVLRNTKLSSSTSSNNINIENLKLGQTYTLHYYYTNDANTTSKVMLTGMNSGIEVFSKTYTSATSRMQEETFTFVATDTSYVFTAETTTTMDGYFTLYDLMLNSGDKKPWEPAASEVYSTVIKMSMLGLQVFAYGSSTLTLMTSQGFQVRRSNNGEYGEIITEFTKDGIITKEIVSIRTKIGKYVLDEVMIDGRIHHIEYMEG